jgi:hypothetical protein
LSQRLVRLALLASATSLFSYASPASAQVPVFQAERAPEPEPPASVEAPLPPAPVPPPGAPAPSALAPPLAGANAPAPAKAEVITAPDAHRAAEARAEAEPDLGTGDDLDSAPRSRWYGWQTLVADGASLGALILGTPLSEQTEAGDTLVGVGLLGYEFVPGIVHFAHRNVGRGFASFGIRLGMPLAGAFLGASLASGCNTNFCEAGGAGVGVLLGMGGAIALDAAVFAYDDPKRSPSRRLGLVPLVSVTPQHAWLGIGGHL